jgi:hypothetical protein
MIYVHNIFVEMLLKSNFKIVLLGLLCVIITIKKKDYIRILLLVIKLKPFF